MRILICCSSGITSRIMMKKLKAQAEKGNRDYQFESANEHFLEDRMENCGLILLAPHIKLEERRKEELEIRHQVRICSMDQELYSEMDTDRIFAYIEEALRVPKNTGEERQKGILQQLSRFTHGKYIQLMMESLMSVSYFILLGSTLNLVSLLPLGKGYHAWISGWHLDVFLRMPLEMVSGLMSLMVLAAFCFHFAQKEKENAIPFILCTLTVYLIHLPDSFSWESVWSFWGADSIAYTFLICIACCEVYRFLGRLRQPLYYRQVFLYMEVFLLFFMIRAVGTWFQWPSLYEGMELLLQYPLRFLSTDLYSFLLFLVFGNILWLLGGHGTSMAVMSILPLYSMINNANLAAYLAGQPAVYPVWTFTHWCFIGGAGNLLALNLLMLGSRDYKNRTIARYSLPTSVFSIGEPLFFGIPIAYNLYFAIPFVLTPVFNGVLCYLVFIRWRLISQPLGIYLENFYPLGLETVILTEGVGGWILYLSLLVLDMAVYLPFYKLYERGKLLHLSGRE